MLSSSSTKLQNRSFHVVERTRTVTSSERQKMKNARAKRAKILLFIVFVAVVVVQIFRCSVGPRSKLSPTHEGSLVRAARAARLISSNQSIN